MLGTSTRLEHVFSMPSPDSLRRAALELAQRCDVMVASGTVCAVAARDAGVQSPVVFAPAGFPVEIGLAQSLRRSGTNFTGISFEAAADTYPKRLQMLKEVIPKLTRVAVLVDGNDSNSVPAMDSLRRLAPAIHVELTVATVHDTKELASVFADLAKRGVQGVVVIAGVFSFRNRAVISQLALSQKLPSVHAFGEAVADGALLSLGPDMHVIAVQAASYVDRILNGEAPAEIPIEQPSRYVVFVNRQSARELGITIPSSLLYRADQIID
jgi:putative tryptophan/tyrosine transport system substrate-binding protein